MAGLPCNLPSNQWKFVVRARVQTTSVTRYPTKDTYISYNKIWVYSGCSILVVSWVFLCISFLSSFFPLVAPCVFVTNPFFGAFFFGGPQLHGVLWQVVLRIVARDKVQNLGIVPIFFKKKINVTSRSASFHGVIYMKPTQTSQKKNKKINGWNPKS